MLIHPPSICLGIGFGLFIAGVIVGSVTEAQYLAAFLCFSSIVPAQLSTRLGPTGGKND